MKAKGLRERILAAVPFLPESGTDAYYDLHDAMRLFKRGGLCKSEKIGRLKSVLSELSDTDLLIAITEYIETSTLHVPSLAKTGYAVDWQLEALECLKKEISDLGVNVITGSSGVSVSDIVVSIDERSCETMIAVVKSVRGNVVECEIAGKWYDTIISNTGEIVCLKRSDINGYITFPVEGTQIKSKVEGTQIKSKVEGTQIKSKVEIRPCMKSRKKVIYNVVTKTDNAVSGILLGELLTDRKLWEIKRGWLYQSGKKSTEDPPC